MFNSEKPSVTKKETGLGFVYTLTWPSGLTADSLCRDHNNDIHLSVHGTGGFGGYGIATLHDDGSVSSHTLPKGLYCSEVFRTEEGDAWVQAAIGVNDKEHEVFFPIDENEIPKTRLRYPASEEVILSASNGTLIPFLRDLWKSKLPRLVINTLDKKNKRTAFKLPKKPYPHRAWMDDEDQLHLFTFDDGRLVQTVFDPGGQIIGSNPIPIPLANFFSPYSLDEAGEGQMIHALETKLSMITLTHNEQPISKKILSIPFEGYGFYSAWKPKIIAKGIWATRFTFGNDVDGGNGWVVARGDELLSAAFSIPDTLGSYVDEKGNVTVLSEESLVLTDLDLNEDGVLTLCFYCGEQARDRKSIYVLQKSY